MTSLRIRLVGALLAVVLLAVGIATAVYVREGGARIENELRARTERALASVVTELDQAGEELLTTVESMRAEGRLGRRLGPEVPVAERVNEAARRLRPGRVDVLIVLDEGGQVLSSGHWPASIGAILALPAEADRPSVRAVSTPLGTEHALLVSARVPLSGAVGTLLVGRFLDPDALAASRERLAVDRLAVCLGAGRCIEGGTPGAGPLTERRHPLPGPDGAVLIVGVDRSPIERLRRGLLVRSGGVALLSALLALGVGLALSRALLRPVEALASAAGRMAQGDLDAQVDSTSRVREVQALVRAFNSLGADLQRSQDQLVQAERVAAWREIARGLAHELKNPLTPIRGAMDVIRRARSLDRPDFDEILDEQADAVVAEVMRLKELADSFARFARLPDPKPEPLDLSALLDDAATLYASEGVQVQRDYGPAPLVQADPTQLRTVLTNLVKNAVEAMEGRGRLTLTVRAVPGAVELRVQDDGPGIAEAVRDRLFTPYVTTKGSRGTGLGLALSHRILIEHGGSIEARDADGGGACFVIRLPAPPPR